MSDQRPAPPYSPASGDAALERAGASPLRSGDPARIGPYVPLGLLGKGGMGRVYLARPADDRPGLAAVKVIRPEYAEDAEFRRRFEREAAVHAQVRTPHAPQLLGTGFQDELLWMATQYVPGLNLAEATRECGGLEPAGVWRLVGELGQALAALAAAGIVHRDLKPSNVILSTQRAHVIDFGISQAAEGSAITTTGNRVGTPAFMSPEYLRDGRCDTASDVFSLAGTLVYAATGRAPFGDGTGVDVMHRVAYEEPKAEIMDQLSESDPPLAALLLACLSKEAEGRPTPQQLTDAATAHPSTPRVPTWQEPLNSRLLARQQAGDVLQHASAEQTGHFRTPTERVAFPAPGPGFGPPAPAQTPAQTPPSAVAPVQPQAAAPTPASTPVTPHGPPARRRGKPYFVVAAVLAVCAVAVSAFLLTRPDSTGTASLAPPVETTASEAAKNSPSPDSSRSASSPSPSHKEKEKEKGEGDKGEDDSGAGAGAAAGTGGGQGSAQPTPTRTETASPGGGGSGSGGDSPAPTRTTAGPTTPPWISQCQYYSGTQLTQLGDKGRRVVQVQCMLDKRGYSVGGAGVDGQFGPDTQAAVRLFQSDKGLAVDGDVGPNTWTALRSST